MTQAFLPFSKPVIDEATIAAVGDVLRSGWITSGPKVQAFEAAAVRIFRRPAGAQLQFRHLHHGNRAAHRRHRRRR